MSQEISLYPLRELLCTTTVWMHHGDPRVPVDISALAPIGVANLGLCANILCISVNYIVDNKLLQYTHISLILHNNPFKG